ncbi:unnamed protein product [Ilex paraguariensis]|uniref:Uncharacterized protein n=1 Tax=Ilex paraguariensis TaxID=185542 RepID=A0ABC8TG67_9AQUA
MIQFQDSDSDCSSDIYSSCWIILPVMLSAVTAERDQLKDVDELAKHKNVEAGAGTVSGILVQVVEHNSCFYLNFHADTHDGLCFFLALQGQKLESSLAEKENCIKELESNLCEQKEVSNRQHNEIRLLTERLTNEARRIKLLEREGDRLRSEISLLESKVGLQG